MVQEPLTPCRVHSILLLALLVASAFGLQGSSASNPFRQEPHRPIPPRDEAFSSFDWATYGYSLFGSTVSRAGDVDLDGQPDFLVANPGLYGDLGIVWVLSGRDGTTIHRVESVEKGDGFGHDLQSAGDVDADGYPDWIVGSLVERSQGGEPLHPSDRSGSRNEIFQGILRRDPGYASVFSGRTGERLLLLQGEERGDLFGFAVGGAGDIDGDGHADLIVGAPRARQCAGSVYVFSGRDASLLRRLDAAKPDERLGVSVCGADDLDSDGRPDVIIGMGCNAGARAFSSHTGALLWTAGIGPCPAWDVVRLRLAGDLDEDGARDVVMGNMGVVGVISGRKGSTLRLFEDRSESSFGAAVDCLDDLDGDGTIDFVAGEPGANIGIGRVLVLSTMTGDTFAAIDGADDLWASGRSIAAIGDIDQDGYTDFAVGGENSMSHESGRARVYSGRTRKLLMEFVRLAKEVRRMP